jgi:hypothetical protein
VSASTVGATEEVSGTFDATVFEVSNPLEKPAEMAGAVDEVFK